MHQRPERGYAVQQESSVWDVSNALDSFYLSIEQQWEMLNGKKPSNAGALGNRVQHIGIHSETHSPPLQFSSFRVCRWSSTVDSLQKRLHCTVVHSVDSTATTHGCHYHAVRKQLYLSCFHNSYVFTSTKPRCPRTSP